MFNRRNFIASLVASASIDPERDLWVQGKKIYSIPEPALYDPAIALPNMIPLAQEMARKFNKRAWDRLMWDMEFSEERASIS